jgi:hypothetical protein
MGGYVKFERSEPFLKLDFYTQGNSETEMGKSH